MLAAAVLLPFLGPRAAGVGDEPEQRVEDDEREDEEHEHHVEPPALAVDAVAGARFVRPQVLFPFRVVGAVVEAGLDAPHARHHLHRAAARAVAPRQALSPLHVGVWLHRSRLLHFVPAVLKRNFVYVFAAVRTRLFLGRAAERDVSSQQLAVFSFDFVFSLLLCYFVVRVHVDAHVDGQQPFGFGRFRRNV